MTCEVVSTHPIELSDSRIDTWRGLNFLHVSCFQGAGYESIDKQPYKVHKTSGIYAKGVKKGAPRQIAEPRETYLKVTKKRVRVV